MDKLTEEKIKQAKTETLNIKLKVKETEAETFSASEEKYALEISPETETKEDVEIKQTNSSYINSFKDMTVSDIREMQVQVETKEVLDKKEELISQQFETDEKIEEVKTENIIEKPNYDLLEENQKIVKLKKNTKEKKKKKVSKKFAGFAIALTLAVSGIICVVNTILIDNYSAQFFQIEDKYNFNLLSYLRNIYNLDTTKESMELFDTYPEEVLDAGEQNQQTNWFDRICNFFGKLFGG